MVSGSSLVLGGKWKPYRSIRGIYLDVAISFGLLLHCPFVVPALILISFRLIPLQIRTIERYFDATGKAKVKRNKAEYMRQFANFLNLLLDFSPMVFTLCLVALFSMKVETLGLDMLLSLCFSLMQAGCFDLPTMVVLGYHSHGIHCVGGVTFLACFCLFLLP